MKFTSYIFRQSTIWIWNCLLQKHIRSFPYLFVEKQVCTTTTCQLILGYTMLFGAFSFIRYYHFVSTCQLLDNLLFQNYLWNYNFNLNSIWKLKNMNGRLQIVILSFWSDEKHDYWIQYLDLPSQILIHCKTYLFLYSRKTHNAFEIKQMIGITFWLNGTLFSMKPH